MMLWPFLVSLFASLTLAAGNSINFNDTLGHPYSMTRMTSYGVIAYSIYDCYNVSYVWKYDLRKALKCRALELTTVSAVTIVCNCHATTA